MPAFSLVNCTAVGRCRRPASHRWSRRRTPRGRNPRRRERLPVRGVGDDYESGKAGLQHLFRLPVDRDDPQGVLARPVRADQGQQDRVERGSSPAGRCSLRTLPAMDSRTVVDCPSRRPPSPATNGCCRSARCRSPCGGPARVTGIRMLKDKRCDWWSGPRQHDVGGGVDQVQVDVAVHHPGVRSTGSPAAALTPVAPIRATARPPVRPIPRYWAPATTRPPPTDRPRPIATVTGPPN